MRTIDTRALARLGRLVVFGAGLALVLTGAVMAFAPTTGAQDGAELGESSAIAPMQLTQPQADESTAFGNEVAYGADMVAVAGDGTTLYERAGAGWSGTKLTERHGPLAISEDRVLVGDLRNGVFLYERIGGDWVESLVTDRVVGQVAFHGLHPVVVGQSGVLYMYRRNLAGEWIDDRLGVGFRSVAADENRIVVGKTAATDQNTAGLVTVFDATSSSDFEISALFPSDSSQADGFGSAIALDGDRIAVGADGKAYVFENDPVRGWVERSLPVPRDAFGPNGTAFGFDVDIDGERALVGSPNGSLLGLSGAPSAAYVYTPNALGNWSLEDSFRSPGGSESFGYSVALSASAVVAGSPVAAGGAGRTFVYGEAPIRTTSEVSYAVSCLADNGRIDTNIVNTSGEATMYRVEFEGLTPRVRTVSAGDWWRSPVTGRSDGTYAVTVSVDGVIVSEQTVTVACDQPRPLVTPEEVQVLSACRDGSGYVLFQMVNATNEAKPYVVEFAGVPNRSTTAARFGATVRATTGRPDGTYGVTIRSGTSVVDAFAVTVDCVPD